MGTHTIWTGGFVRNWLVFQGALHGEGRLWKHGFFHWKIISNYIRPGVINLIKDETIEPPKPLPEAGDQASDTDGEVEF